MSAPPSTTATENARQDRRIEDREATEDERAVVVPWAEARLICDWPEGLGGSAVRGAVAAAIDRIVGGTGARDDDSDGWHAHIDWHGHVSETETIQTFPSIVYRLRHGIPRVHITGPRISERLSELARVGALTLPAGEVLDVDDIEIRRGETSVLVSRSRWWSYRTASPIFPARVSRRRKPGGDRNRENTPEIRAWAGALIAQSITDRLIAWGWTGAAPVRVQIERYQAIRVEWHKLSDRANTGHKTDITRGLHAEFVCNALLPPGIPIGARGSVGWGEIREIQP